MTRLLFLPIFLLTLACQEIEFTDGEQQALAQVCGIENPLEELPWLEEMMERDGTESACQVFGVVQGTYKKQTVYTVIVSGALCCTCGNVVYNCEGEVVLLCNRKEEKKIRDQKVIWEAVYE
ncbi:hypothetical protein [Catalinimonas niigatensis]|uniref:hypothetical protein n=1 Tax=Catalinimonas niigatensis TaxID=1397264 RepID=UPI00266623B6|nr:hypothetical protein [Catalinimonas niigatensis]WPP48150.1 hypothetical protein PZB72_15880 [Catalinimonas niigatensis]